MKRNILIAVIAGASLTVFAQTPDVLQPVDLSGITGFFVGLAAKYPWIATALLIIGGLRVVLKPIMMALDSYVQKNCSPEEYAKLQKIESSQWFKWLSIGLDIVGSVKVPVLKKASVTAVTPK